MAHPNVESALSMDHISGVKKDTPEEPSLADMKAQIEGKPEAQKDPETPPDPREKRNYTFKFEHIAEDGTIYKGLFTNTVLTLGQRLKVAQLESELIGGVPYESIDPFFGGIAKAMAHMTFSLGKPVQQSPEAWADDFRTLDTASPVLALFEEVMAHEAIFLGVGKGDSKSEGTKA